MRSSFISAGTRIALLALLAGPPAGAEERWIPVQKVSEEYDYVRNQRCACGGTLEVKAQGTGEQNGKHWDKLSCRCLKCNRAVEFTFDVTAIFHAMELADSDEARREAYAQLDKKHPAIDEKLLPEFKALLKHENPHFRSWAANALRKLSSPQAIETLLDACLRAGILESIDLEKSLAGIGPPLLPIIKERLKTTRDDRIRWELIDLLEHIPTAESRAVAEHELLTGSPRIRRIAALALGRLAQPEAEPALLRCAKEHANDDDDALVWALGRCGSPKSFEMLRAWVKSKDERMRLAAIAALGLAHDRESIPLLIEIVKTNADPRARFNAIYALGHLKAQEAVPVLIELLRAVPKYGSIGNSIGIYGGDEGSLIEGSFGNVSIAALAKIGDKLALPEFLRILQDDRYYLDHDEVAKAAAALGWRELIPAIIERMEKDQKGKTEAEKAREEYAPYLRKLTGQNFKEDPAAWRKWMEPK